MKQQMDAFEQGCLKQQIKQCFVEGNLDGIQQLVDDFISSQKVQTDTVSYLIEVGRSKDKIIKEQLETIYKERVSINSTLASYKRIIESQSEHITKLQSSPDLRALEVSPNNFCHFDYTKYHILAPTALPWLKKDIKLSLEKITTEIFKKIDDNQKMTFFSIFPPEEDEIRRKLLEEENEEGLTEFSDNNIHMHKLTLLPSDIFTAKTVDLIGQYDCYEL